MAARVHMPLKIIVFDENDIWRQIYELRKRLQGLRVDIEVALPSETHLKPYRGSTFQIITLIGLTASQEEKTELPLQ
jgi:hypothetical protein